MQNLEHRAVKNLVGEGEGRDGGGFLVSGLEEEHWQDISHWTSSACLSFLLPWTLERGVDNQGGSEILRL